MKFLILVTYLLLHASVTWGWGFWAHRKINRNAVFLLPPEMMVLYKPNISFISDHAVDPDKRRYVVTDEGARHYIDLDYYGHYPYAGLPRIWQDAVAKFTRDTLIKNGIVPWHVQAMLGRLTQAFKEKDYAGILKNSSDMGHYIADACVPLHATSNYNGQLSNQVGIHAFWESRIPELLTETTFDLLTGKARYLDKPGEFIWDIVVESGRLSDSVLAIEKKLSSEVSPDSKFSFEERNGIIIRQYSSAYAKMFHNRLNGMVENRMRTAIYTIACFWYTAWVNAGQPDLASLTGKSFSAADIKEFEELNNRWRNASIMRGREEE